MAVVTFVDGCGGYAGDHFDRWSIELYHHANAIYVAE